MKRSYDNTDISSRVLKRNKPVGSIFNGLLIYILSSRFGPRRLKIFETQVLNNGGQLYYTVTEDPKKVTHLIVEETIDKETLLRICVVKHFSNAKFLKCTWLTQCLKHNDLLPVNDYVVYENNHPKCDDSTVNLCSTFNDKNDTKLSEDGNTVLKTEGCSNSNYAQNKFLDKFACAHSSSGFAVNLNEHITSELEKLSSAYESRKDTWRAVGYHKAIAALKNYPSKIESWEETKNIRGIGERLRSKIKEILEIGKLRKAEELCDNEETKVLQLFMGVWGAGATTANNWYLQGFKSLEDLRSKASLTKHQEIGLRYYDELNERMSREEVEQIGNEVKSAAEVVKKGLDVIVCGSYRRGKSTCGDVDVLITHPDGVSHENVFKALLEKLKENGFLTDDLVIQENNGNQQKYLGVCKLPGYNSKHRRLDIIVVPYAEFAPAIMYFTGSAHFNRSMRLLATKVGMSLSEHGLRSGIVRDGRESVTGGVLLETPTEESIFRHLGLQYLPPCERNH